MSATGPGDGRARRIRIVHVLPDLGTGGAEQQVLVMLKRLDRAVWEPAVLCTHEYGILEEEFRSTGAELHCAWKKGWTDLGFFPRLVREIRRLKPDVVHTSLLSSNFWGRLASLFLPRRVVVVASEHSVEPERHRLVKLINRALARGSDLVYGVSPAVIDFLTKDERIPERKLALIYCGILPERVQTCLRWSAEERLARRRELGIPDDAFVVGHVARPSRVKRLDVLGEAIGLLSSRGVPVKLMVVGRPPSPAEQPNWDALTAALARHGAGDVIVHRGFRQDISPEYAVMDAVIQSSESEALPNVVIEAQFMERPVVATDVGGTGVMITDGETGWLAPNEDAAGLADGLFQVWSNPDEARRRAVAGRERAERLFSADTFVANVTSAYVRLLRAKGHTLPQALNDEGGSDA